MGNDTYGINNEQLSTYIHEIKEIANLGVEIGLVIGGGNIFRGMKGVSEGIDRVNGDYMGMMATVINGLAFHSVCIKQNIQARLFTATRMEPIGELYSKQKAKESLQRGEIAILTGGTGNPFFSTDSAAALRACEIQADVLLKGTRVDGVFSADPEKEPSAEKYDIITFDEAYSKGLSIMDLTAFTLCKENSIPILVFNMNKVGNLYDIITGKNTGTLIKN